MSAVEDHPPIVETASWPDEDATSAFAARMAASPAVANAFVSLQGDLGAGKTTFVRHLLRALGVTGRIKSPTYAVVEPHRAGALAIWHFDFYRFNDPREWEDAGLRDIFASPGLKLAEWPQQVAGALPVPDLEIHIDTAPDDTRTVRLVARTSAGRALLKAATA